jgi:calcium-dependent protein kinase
MQEDALRFNHVFTAENPKKLDDVYDVDKRTLGEGSYGQVMKARHKDTQVVRAVKAIDVAKISDPARFQAEVEIQQSLDHPHIVKLYETFKDKKRYYLVMELCTGGELFDRIVEESEAKGEGAAFDEVAASKILQQIMGAINYLHAKNYCHRDIKPENFLMQNKDREAPIKVIDFGLAKNFTPGKDELRTKAGTPYYVAPEVLGDHKKKGYSEKCDIWSCGVLAYIILCGYPPFYGDTDSQILRMVKRGKYEYPSPDWDGISTQAKDFIDKMLTMDSSKRPTAEQMVEHSWLKTAKPRQASLPKDLGNRLSKFRTGGKLKKVVLTLIAQQMSEEEIKSLIATFEDIDKDRSGTLSPKEIQAAMQKHKLSMPADLAQAMEQMDTDGSGTIDYTEFIAATLTHQQYCKKEVLWAAFRKFDVDESGSITLDEIKKVLQDENVERLNALFQEGDTNQDGKITFEEFCNMMSDQAAKEIKAH